MIGSSGANRRMNCSRASPSSLGAYRYQSGSERVEDPHRTVVSGSFHAHAVARAVDRRRPDDCPVEPACLDHLLGMSLDDHVAALEARAHAVARTGEHHDERRDGDPRPLALVEVAQDQHGTLRRGEPRDWWALAWLRGTEIATDALWSRSKAFRRPGARAGLWYAGLSNTAMAAGYGWLASRR